MTDDATALAEDSKPVRGRRKLAAIVLAVAVAVGLVSVLAQRQFAGARLDPTPLPRPWINAPYIKTPMEVVDEMLALAQVQESDLLFDLGCGDGRIAITAAEKYGCRSRGFDIEPERIRESRENAAARGVEDRTAFEEKDVFTLDLSEADVVAMYLLPRYMTRLIPQFQQMRPGSRIVAHDFPIEGVPPDRTVEVTSADGELHRVYLWTTPLKLPEPPDDEH